MTNVLYLYDPNSIHDVKWTNFFVEKEGYSCFFICREKHYQPSFENTPGFLGFISDYSVFKPWKNSIVKKKIKNWISINKIGLIHIFYAEPNVLWANYFKEFCPVILTTRGSDVLVGIKQFKQSTAIKDNILSKAYSKALKACSSITSTSRPQIEFLSSNFKIDQRIELIRTGIEVDKFRQPSDNLRNLVFFPRVMQPLYQHEQALEAIKNLPKELKQAYTFIFVDKESKNRDYVQKIDSLIQEETTAKIDFYALLNPDEYQSILGQSKVVVMTPKSDGAPVSGMEALAAGCQLILPDLDYDRDLFEKALFYKKGNVADLTSTLIKALETNSPVNIDQEFLTNIDRNQEMKKLETIYLNQLKKVNGR